MTHNLRHFLNILTSYTGNTLCPRKAAIILLVFSSMFATVEAQIQGVVIDDDENPVEGAAVILMQLPDSTYMAGTVTDETGKFLFETTSADTPMFVRVEAIGYEKTTMPASAGNAITVRLPHNSVALSEVVVKAPSISVSPGMFSFLPGDLIKDVNNAFSVLEYVPLLTVNAVKDEVSIIGSEGCKFLINGKDPIMPPAAIIQMLRNSDPGRIKKVEIWLQPDINRQGEGPIINLVLAPRKGSMGTADQTFVYKNALYSRQQLWYGGEWDKWQFSAFVSANEQKDKSELLSRYTVFNPADQNSVVLDQIKSSKDDNDSYGLATSLGASLDLGHKNSLAIYGHLSFDYEKNNSQSNTNWLTENFKEETSNLSRRGFSPEFALVEIKYSHDLDTLGSSLSAKAYYTGMFSKTDNTFIPVTALDAYRRENNSNSIQFKTEWFKMCNRRLWFILGLNAFHDNVHNKIGVSDNGNLSTALVSTDDLTQLQTQADLFLSGNYKLSEIVSINAGATGRWYKRSINQKIQDVRHNFEDFYLLPQVSASFSFHPQHMLMGFYNYSIRQPSYSDTNPIVTWTSPEYYYTGNPNLKAVTTHTAGFLYSMFSKITLRGNFSFNDNISKRATIPHSDGITSFQPLAIGKSQEYSLTAAYSNSFFSRRWRLSGNVNWKLIHLDNNRLPVAIAEPSQTTSQWAVNLNNSVTLGSDRSWTLYLHAYYRSPQRFTFSNTTGYASFDIDITKSFDFGGRISLEFNNLANHKSHVWYECDSYTFDARHILNQRSILVKFDISFGRTFDRREIGDGFSEFQTR